MSQLKQRPLAILVACGLVVAAILVGWWLWPDPILQANQLVEQAYQYRQRGQLYEAEQAALKASQLDVTRDDAMLLAAESAAGLNEYARAYEHAIGVSPRDPSLYGGASLLAAKLAHRQLARLSDADRHYRNVLVIDPNQVEANQGFAQLCGETGRREEAIPAVLRLIAAGQAEDLLMLLARENGVLNNRELLEKARQEHNDPLAYLGLAWHAGDAADHSLAIKLLAEAIKLEPKLAAAHAALGPQYIAQGDYERAARWSIQLLPEAESYVATWVARGRLAEHLEQRQEAIRCYLEAAVRQPELKTANARLAQLLSIAGEPQQSIKFDSYVRKLQELTDLQDRIFFSSEPSGLQSLLELVSRFRDVGRYWEAIGWMQLAVSIEPNNPAVRSTMASIAERLRDRPSWLVDPKVAPAFGVDREKYPLLKIESSQQVDTESEQDQKSAEYQLVDRTQSAGFEFVYFNGVQTKPPRRMFEFTGGGIAILDYDLDGWPDAFLSQGTDWPPTIQPSRHHDQLFRNIAGQQLAPVPAAIQELAGGFGQGVTQGDFDADGFPDLYVANAGGNNCLYRNNGDGTFSDVTDTAGINDPRWTTSVAMVDLTGDGLPDIYDANYVRGDDVFDRICADAEGHPMMCMPFDFDPERDTLWVNQGNGQFADQTETLLNPAPYAKGLGLLAFDADGSGRLSLVVANDTTPNFFWMPATGNGTGLKDQATVAGVAFNEDGKTEGCMGIAAGDIDHNGYVDLLVTNFLYESNSLYLAQGPGLFADRTRAIGLHEPSLGVLGFGTQFIDVDLDGELELFVANGHIDDFTRNGRPFEMSPQLFAWAGRQYAQVPEQSLTEYFQGKWLGRAVARWDWNRDGREDLLVGHLYDQSRLLVNETAAVGNYLAIQLVGVNSSRDAIGAKVSVAVNGQPRSYQLTGGDGYQCRNETRLVIGLAESEMPTAVKVKWPGGEEESFNLPSPKSEWLLIEGRGTAVERTH